MRTGLRLAVVGAAAAWAMSGAAAQAPGPHCHVGVYRLSDGSLVDVAPDDAALRWRTLSGRTGHLEPGSSGGWTSSLGWTDEPDHVALSFGTCRSGAIRFEGQNGKLVPLAVIDTSFTSNGVQLAGRLVLPEGHAPVPVMVIGHGSERFSALVNTFKQRLYPASGVGVFVFDKRGTGKSGGKYTQDFDLLASDAAAAMAEARRLAGKRASSFGFEGGSQAGWVLPLAAQKTPADFVIVGYGIAASPLVEDRTETLQDLEAKGWGADVLAKAVEVTDATGGVIAARFTGGYDRLAAVVAKYGKEPWFKDLNGEFTGEIVKHSEAELRAEGPKHDEGTTWDFDAVGSLRRLDAPLLWMLAGADTEGAGPETKRNLLQLRDEGKRFTVAEFPNTEHGIHLLRTANGKRDQVGYAPDYFRMELEFARNARLDSDYPKVEVAKPKR